MAHWPERLFVIERVLGLLRRIRRGPTTRGGQQALLVAAGVGFIAMSVLGYRSLPDDREPLNVGLLVLLMVVGGPAMLLVTANEYRLLGRMCQVDINYRSALGVTVAAAAANLLPLPGAVLVRSGDLAGRGAGARRIATSITSLGLTFVAVAALSAAIAFALADQPLAAAIAFVIGLALIVGVSIVQHRVVGSAWKRLVGTALWIETQVMAVVVARLAVVLAAMGVPTGLIESVVLGSASVLSTAIAIFPGGLGLREGLSGVLGAVVGIEVSTGVVASAIDRITYLVSLAILSLGSLAWRRKEVDLDDGETVETVDGGTAQAEGDGFSSNQM